LKTVNIFADIKTDVPGRVCSFTVTKKDFDYKAKLTELAKKNKHLKDFTIKKK